jgi:acyl-CoA reductase-like NAD-dependent aldehyde dehydrogenase
LSIIIWKIIGFNSDIPSYQGEGMFEQVTQEVKEKTIIKELAKVQRKYKTSSIQERLKRIDNVREYVLQNQEYIIDRIQAETKKSRSDALMSEIFPLMDYIHFLEAELKKNLKDQKAKTDLILMGKKSMILHEPLGVVLAITPWNYPFYQAMLPVLSALSTGNTIVVKPSEFTPLKGLCEEVLEAAGFPSDTYRFVYGDGKVGAELIDLKPKKIFFTGSVATGKKIMKQASEYLIPVELELGGKDPMIVREDATLKRAVAGALWGGLTNFGQSCTSIENLYVHHSLYNEFKSEMVKELAKLTHGVDKDGNADLGEMTVEAQSVKILNLLDDALAKGAKIINDVDLRDKKLKPILLENVDSSMDIYHEEIFGPVICLYSYEHEADLVEELNASSFGLSASIWSKDKVAALELSRKLETGSVSINNVMLTEGNPHLPFGGTKDSGFGKTKGIEGLQGYLHKKAIILDSDSKKIEVNWYPFTTKKYKLFTGLMASFFSHSIFKLFKFAFYGLQAESVAQRERK